MFNKIGLYIVALLFILFATVQYNDPDGLKWILLYLFVAGLSCLSLLRKNKDQYIGLVIVVCIVWMISLVPQFANWVSMGMPSITESMKAEAPHIEFTREFFGLFVSILALLYIRKVDQKLKS